MKIAIVILNWNGKALLQQFLPSVVAHSKEATIYLADNASSDDSVLFVAKNYPDVTVIKNTQNGGYAKGYNDALQHIDADLYCLLNSDVEVTKHWLQPIIEAFKNDSKTAIIQPKILDYKQKKCFEYAGAAGGYIDKYAYPYCRGRIFNTIEKDTGQYNDTQDITWASGACFFIKKSVFNELGGFDNSFFAHMEEIDLCWRAKNTGYNVKYVGSSSVFHIGGATLSAVNPKKTYLNFRNSLFTLTKNAGGTICLLIFTRLILDGIAGLNFLFIGQPSNTLAILKAHFSYYLNLKQLLNQRKQLKQSTTYYNKTSIVWLYFFKHKKVFKNL